MKKQWIAAVLALCVAGCGTGSGTESPGSGQPDGTEPAELKIEDIEYETYYGLKDNGRYMLMDITNHSDYTFVEMTMIFTEKQGLTDEERDVFYRYIQEVFGASDEEIEEVRSRQFGVSAEYEGVLSPGDTGTADMYINQSYYYLRNEEIMNLVVPDYAKITMTDGRKVYTALIDCIAGKVTIDKTARDAHEWSSFAIGDKVPEPEALIIEKSLDYDDVFSFYACGLAQDGYDAYIRKCEEAGFKVQSRSGDYCTMTSEEGYEISLSYDAEESELSVHVSSAD
ncbi:MAG: hypothetical protein IKF51_02495 [Solobacterium sp.]|nr:hypothetical protein [Solobacterium sp.]